MTFNRGEATNASGVVAGRLGVSSEAEDGPEPREAVGEAADAMARLEQALDRIETSAQPLGARARDDAPPLAEIADRLDALIAQLRTALAERSGED